VITWLTAVNWAYFSVSTLRAARLASSVAAEAPLAILDTHDRLFADVLLPRFP